MLTVSPEIQELILRRASTAEIKQAAIKSGMRTLRADGLLKAKQGVTTLDEVLRATSLD